MNLKKEEEEDKKEEEIQSKRFLKVQITSIYIMHGKDSKSDLNINN